MLANVIYISFISLGDGQSFVTRLVHIDPEQANGVLKQNGKRFVLSLLNYEFFHKIINHIFSVLFSGC